MKRLLGRVEPKRWLVKGGPCRYKGFAAAVGERISKGEGHNLGAVAPFSTKTSFLQRRAAGSAFTPKLVEVVFGPGSTRLAEQLSSLELI